MQRELLAALLRIPLFQRLTPLQLTEIARHAERIIFDSGEFITTAGAAGDGAILLLAGAAERLPNAGVPGVPTPVEPGSLIGETAMFVQHTYGSTIVARTRTRCVKLTRSGMHAQMANDPDLADRLFRSMAAHLREVAAELHRIDSTLRACSDENARLPA
jgi:CRP-like cAMP-binding protein